MSENETESHENLTVAEFFEEYWILLFFGAFFFMTMFLPLLFMNRSNLLYWGIVISLCIAMCLLTIPGLMSRNKKRP